MIMEQAEPGGASLSSWHWGLAGGLRAPRWWASDSRLGAGRCRPGDRGRVAVMGALAWGHVVPGAHLAGAPRPGGAWSPRPRPGRGRGRPPWGAGWGVP